MKLRTMLALSLLLALLLSGCRVPSGETETEPAQEDAWDITWQKGFRSTDFPEGGMMNDQIGFARTDGKTYTVDVVSRAEMEAYDDGGYLPRCSFFAGKYPEELDLLSHCLSYALFNRYERFLLPTPQDFMDKTEEAGRNYEYSITGVTFDMSWSYQSQLEDGTAMYYCFYHLKPEIGRSGSYAQFAAQQKKAFAAAQEIVASIPETATTDYDKVLYLYQYLTDNVYYAYDDYYPGEEDYYDHCVNAYYDTLVDGLTVCAGYGATFAWLCELAGITAMSVTGQASETESHLWTVAEVDGGWYWFDPTWDAQTDPWNYDYFGISDGDMEERGFRHLYSYYEEILPACPEALPLPTAPSGTVDITDAGAWLTHGTVDGRTYRNTSLGFGCELPKDFTVDDDTKIGDQESAYAWTDLSAADQGANMLSVRVQVNEYFTILNAEEFADLSVEAATNSLKASGMTDIVCEKRQADFLGETHWEMTLTAQKDGNTVYQITVFYKVNNAFATISAISYQSAGECEALLSLFFAL